MSIVINRGLASRNGRSVAFKKSPNVGGALKPEFVVLHDTASGLNSSGSISWLTDPASKVSAHVVIGRDGTITQLVPFNVKAWHAGQSIWRGRPLLNGFSIGIEIVNPGRLTKIAEGVYKGVTTIDTNKDPSLVVKYGKTAAHGEGYWLAYTAAQVNAVRDLCEALCAEYPIQEILTHWLISPGRKVDTNPLFPLEQLRKDLAGQLGFKPVKLLDAAPPADTDESDGGEDSGVPEVEPGNDYASPTGQQDQDESAGGSPLRSIWRSRIVQGVVGAVTSSLASAGAFLTDWRVIGILCLTAVVGFGLFIIYRRSLVH